MGTLALGLGARTVWAQQESAPAETGWERHINSITGGKEPIEDNVTLELPEVAENGNLVPFTVAVDYEMSNTDYIQSLHVIATANPAPVSYPSISHHYPASPAHPAACACRYAGYSRIGTDKRR